MNPTELLATVLVGIAILVSGAGSAGLVEGETTSADGTATWTFMIYMAADVSDELPWLQDVNEMEAANQADGTSIIVLLDPPNDGDTRLLEIAHDDGLFDPDIVSMDVEDEGAVVPVSGEVNTGSPETLADFIAFSATNYDADHLVLVLWGHGAGWRGMCPDGIDLLTLPELRSALAMSRDSLQRDIDMIVLDICSGATLELAFEVSDYAELLVGSELGVPAEGLPYTEILNDLASSPGQTPSELGAAIVDEYVHWATYGSAYPVSASLFDLGRAEDIRDSLDKMAFLGVAYDRLFHGELADAVALSAHVDEDWLVDFGTLCGSISSRQVPLELSMAALSLGVISSEAVAHNAQFSPDGEDTKTTGMALYVPSDQYEDEDYADLLISELTSWMDLSQMIRQDKTPSESGPAPEVTTTDSPEDHDDLPDAATVAWEASEEWNYTSFAVHVFRVEGHGLVDCGMVHSTGSTLSVSGVAGRLMLSASAYNGTEALAHHTESVTLSSTVKVDIELQNVDLLDGEDIEVVLASPTGASIVAACTGASCEIPIVIPDWIDTGDLLVIQVRSAGDGRVVSEKTVLISDADVSVTIRMFSMPMDQGDDTTIAILLASTLVVLGAAAIVLVNFALRRRAKR